MSNLKRRIIDDKSGHVWAIYGQHGVISWELLKNSLGTTNGPIGIHSPRPQFGDDKPCDGCEFLEGACYADVGYIAGDKLGKAWVTSGRDDEVIWRTLAEWYEGRLASA
jgi:hypothetical protein